MVVRWREVAAFTTPVGWAVIAAVVAGLAFGGWMLVTAPGRSAKKAADAQAQSTINSGETKAAKDAIGVVTGNAAADAATDAQTRKNQDEILSAPGASAPVDPGVAAAGRRAVCMRKSARDLPACKQLLDARS